MKRKKFNISKAFPRDMEIQLYLLLLYKIHCNEYSNGKNRINEITP